MNSRCIECGSPEHELELRQSDEVELRRCLSCDLVFLKDWGAEFDPQLYEYYRARFGAKAEDLFDPLTDERYRFQLARWGLLAPGRRVLDVGCGQGQFVRRANELGWSARGIDLSQPAVEIAQSLGIPALHSDFFSDAWDGERFDLITMFEFIEHVPAPGSFIRRAYQLLNPSGLLFVTTPNWACIDRRLAGAHWEPIHREHLSYFEPQRLLRLIRANSRLRVLETTAKNIDVAAIARRVRGGGAPRPGPDSPAVPVRERVESSAVLRTLKTLANGVLDATRLGSSLTVLCRA